MKVLIVKLSAFGDIIHSLPALDDVLARPGVSEVHWLVDVRYQFVTEVFPPQVRVHTIDLKGKNRLSEVWRVVKALRAEKFDVALDLQGLMKSALLARLICSKVFGIDQKYMKEKPASWMQQAVSFDKFEQHVVQQYKKVAAGPWLQDSPAVMAYQAPTIHQTFSDEAVNALLVPNKPLVVLNLGGAWETKVLPNSTWLAVAKGAVAKGYQVVWSWGSTAEFEKALNLNEHNIGLVLPKRFEMNGLCSLLQQAAFVVAADTGVLHLASALGAPTISFWGASAAWRSSPLAASDIQVQSNPACGPCFKRTCNAFICMDMIRADDIVSHL
ncbi:MAG: hypothetical protein AUK35_10840 [Zetaproteobacteria bacterium CG2_30_46_52]|nr:MAG: hypothetical protein AUK35_10840 [Zetaproteobacteria bacterium CG2_30_46_52]